MFVKIVKSLSLLGLVSFVFLFGFMLVKADLSLQKVDTKRLNDKESRPMVSLVSYADGHEVFYQNQHMLGYSAQNKGIDVVFNYRRSTLDPKFCEEYKDILSIKSGTGLWLWKPEIILETMEKMPENSIIIYTDVGFIFVRPVDEIINILGDKDVVLMNIDEYHTSEKLIDWLPKSIATEWGIDKLPPNERPKFIESGIMVVRNNARAKKFITKWKEICAERRYAFLKFDIKNDQIKGFTYDQSLLSLAAYKYGEHVRIIPKKEMKVCTVYHHRHPGNNKPVLPLMTLPLKDIREWIEGVWPSFFMYFGF